MALFKFTHWFRHHGATWKVAVFSGLLLLFSQLLIYGIVRDISVERLLALQVSFSRDFFLETIGTWKLSGVLPLYKYHFIPDYLHPVWYSVFLATMMALTFQFARLSSRWDGLLLLPFVAGLLDLLENTLHLILLSDIRAVTSGKIFAAALSANLKWGLIGVSLVMIIVLATIGKVRRRPPLVHDE